MNKNFTKTFDNDYPQRDRYTPYLYAGMLFNVSMEWLNNDCEESIDTLAQAVVDAIYFEN